MKRRVFILWFGSVFVTFLITVCLLGYALLRLLPAYQSSIEDVLSSATGSKVSLQIEYASWRGVNPVIEVSQIKVKDQGFSLNIPKMVIHVNAWASLNEWKFVTQSVVVEQPVLTVYPKEGKLDYQFLQSLSVKEIDEVGGRWSKVLEYLLQQNQLVLDNMQVLICSEDNTTSWRASVNAKYHQSNGAKGILSLAIQPQELKMRHGENGKINLESTIEKRENQYYFDGTLHDNENVLVNLINELTGYVNLKPLMDQQLSFSIESDINRLDSITITGELSQAELKTSLLNESTFNNVVFNLHLFRYQDKFVLGANPLSFVAQHKRYTFRSALFSLDQHRLIMNLPYLNLADFSDLIQLESSSWRKNITLAGVLSDVHFVFDLQEPDLEGVQLMANFNELGIAQSDQSFDFKGLSGELWWQKNHVKLDLNSPSFKMAKNQIFSQAWPEFSLKGEIDITKDTTSLGFSVTNLQLKSDNINFSAMGKVSVPLSNPMDFTLDILGKLQGHKLTTEYQSFLPKKGIPTSLYEWLMKCLYQAQDLDATFQIQGMAREIPYPAHNGTFKIDANINNASLSPYFGLGIAQKVSGSLHFNNEQLRAKVTQGLLANIPISGVDLSIDNIAPHIPSALNILANAQTSSQNIYEYLAQTNHKDFVDQLNRFATYQGALGVQLDIQIPLGDYDKKDQVSGRVSVQNGVINLKKPQAKSLYDVNAEIIFNNQLFTLKQFSAMWDVDTPIWGKGSVDAGNLDNPRTDLQGGIVLPLKPYFVTSLLDVSADQLVRGILPVRFAVKGGLNEGAIEISSNFLGASSTLGAPLNKTMFELMPLSFKSTWQRALQQTQEDKQPRATSLWHIDSKLDFNHETKITAGLNIDGDGVISSLSVYGNIQKLSSQFVLNLVNVVNTKNFLMAPGKEWQQFVQLDMPSAHEIQNTDGCLVAANYYGCVYRRLNRLLKPKIAVTIHELDIFGVSYHELGLKTEIADGYTKLMVQTDQNQSLTIKVPHSLNQTMEVDGTNLFFPLSSSQETAGSDNVSMRLNNLLQTDILRKVPDMNVKLTHVQLGGYSIPNFVMTMKLRAGVLSIPALSAYDQNSKLFGALTLSPTGSHVEANVFSSDWGAMLHNFGYNNLLKGGSGHVEMGLSWPVLVPQCSHISGIATVNMVNGVVLSVDSGIAKYIGLLSLDSYFKRLFMPYDDFSYRGMTFNSVTGTYKLENAIATSTPSIIIDTPSFALVINGRIDLRNKQLNQRIKYQPHFSGTTAAVAGAFGGPVVAVAAYFGGKILGNTLFRNIGLISFDVTGSWDKPILKQVQ